VSASAPANITLLREGGTEAVYFVHDLSGDALSYRTLVGLLTPEVRAVGVQMPEGRAASSLEALAAEHVKAIRAVQPRGPYRFVGWSFGGILAHEIAGQLFDQGERIAWVGMIDAFPMDAGMEHTAADDVALLLLGQIDDAENPDAAALRRLRDAGDFWTVVERAQHMGLLAQGLGRQDVQDIVSLRRALHTALLRHRPRPASERTYLFTSGADPAALAAGWAGIGNAGLQVRHIGGTHWSILREPHVATLAREIELALNSAG
jgi:thioesterase domain-containing protein